MEGAVGGAGTSSLLPSPTAARRAQLVVGLLALAASAAGLLNDFVYDDIPIIRDNVRVHGLAHWRDLVSLPYWPPPFVEQLYRPGALLLFAGEYTAGAGQPLVFRIVSYLLYAASAIGVWRLLSRFVAARAALAGAALFAVHPVHVEAVALGVAQSELIIGIAAVAMVCRYVDARRNGTLSFQDWVFLATVYAFAAIMKENGFILPLLLIAAEVTVLADSRPVKRVRLDMTHRVARDSRLRGYGALAGTAAALVWLRSAVLSGYVMGATSNASLAGLGVGGRLFAMLQVVPMWLRLLVWPLRLQVDFAPDDIAPPAHVGLGEAAGAALVTGAIALILSARSRAPALAFGLTWCGVALLPVSNIVPTGIMLAARTLFLPSIGFVLALAVLGERLVHAGRWPAEQMRRVLIVICALLGTLGIARSASRHLVWNSVHLKVVGSSALPNKARQ